MIILRCIYIYIYKSTYRERETVFPTQYFMHASYTHSYCQQKYSKPCKGETVGSPSHMLQPWRPINRGTISKSECCSWKPPPQKKKQECPSRSTQKQTHVVVYWISKNFPPSVRLLGQSHWRRLWNCRFPWHFAWCSWGSLCKRYALLMVLLVAALEAGQISLREPNPHSNHCTKVLNEWMQQIALVQVRGWQLYHIHLASERVWPTWHSYAWWHVYDMSEVDQWYDMNWHDIMMSCLICRIKQTAMGSSWPRGPPVASCAHYGPSVVVLLVSVFLGYHSESMSSHSWHQKMNSVFQSESISWVPLGLFLQ